MFNVMYLHLVWESSTIHYILLSKWLSEWLCADSYFNSGSTSALALALYISPNCALAVLLGTSDAGTDVGNDESLLKQF